ncbi:hypothetical protein PO909_013952 [Leuciscus waleckii]
MTRFLPAWATVHKSNATLKIEEKNRHARLLQYYLHVFVIEQSRFCAKRYPSDKQWKSVTLENVGRGMQNVRCTYTHSGGKPYVWRTILNPSRSGGVMLRLLLYSWCRGRLVVRSAGIIRMLRNVSSPTIPSNFRNQIGQVAVGNASVSVCSCQRNEGVRIAEPCSHTTPVLLKPAGGRPECTYINGLPH